MGAGVQTSGYFQRFYLSVYITERWRVMRRKNGGAKKKGTILPEAPPHSVVVKIACIFHFFGGIGGINNWVLRSLGITSPEIFLSRMKVMRKNCAHVLGAPAASARSGTWR